MSVRSPGPSLGLTSATTTVTTVSDNSNLTDSASAPMASYPLSAHRVVKLTEQGVRYSDPTVLEDGDATIGITTAAADSGDWVRYQDTGDLTDPSWNWSVGPIFCGPSGTLVQSVPAGAWLRQVADAIGPQHIVIHLFQPIYFQGV